MAAFIAWLKQTWNAVKSNPVFVTVSSAAVGAIVSGIQDELASGHIDWSRSGLNKLMGYAFTAAIAAIVHLYRMPPNPQMLVTTPPATQVHEAPATLQPESSKDKPAN